MTPLAQVTDLAERAQAQAIESVLIGGDLGKLTPEQRVSYYRRVCDSLGLNPLTKPFAYITLNGKLTLYALKDATEQLRSLHGVSITSLETQRHDDVFVVTAKAAKADGRTDAATGAVAIGNLKGENLANAIMKCETKAKRRVTLSICGLGMLDETEAEPLMVREPQHVVEAPKALQAMPEGTARILRVVPKKARNVEWAELTYVTATGEELEAAMPADPRGSGLALAEQLCQNNELVELTVIVNSKGKRVVESMQRFAMTPSELPPAPDGEPAL
jgi:hypothetical protein